MFVVVIVKSNYISLILMGTEMKTNKVVLVRHGESVWNKKNKFCGWHDVPLSPKGEEDAVVITSAALIKHKFVFDLAFTSSLMRAQKTLDIILREMHCRNIHVSYDWRLNERHYGNLTGHNKRLVANKYGEDQVQKWRRGFDVLPPVITTDNPYYSAIRENPNFVNISPDRFPFTESLELVLLRVVPVWETIFRHVMCGERVLIVAHGTVLRALAKHIENIPSTAIATFNIPNSIPCVYEFDMTTKKLVGKITYLADENFLNQQVEKTASIGD